MSTESTSQQRPHQDGSDHLTVADSDPLGAGRVSLAESQAASSTKMQKSGGTSNVNSAESALVAQQDSACQSVLGAAASKQAVAGGQADAVFLMQLLCCPITKVSNVSEVRHESLHW